MPPAALSNQSAGIIHQNIAQIVNFLGALSLVQAAKEFIQKHSEYEMETPRRLFNESELSYGVTYWLGA